MNKEIIGYSTLYNCDCKDLMAQYPDKHFDLAIVDPPYGILSDKKVSGFMREMNTYSTHNKNWDVRPSTNYFKELFRVSKNQIIWGLQYFVNDLPDFTAPIIWDKVTGDSFFADAELAFCSLPGTARIFKHQWCGCFKGSEKQEKNIQSCQKPIALYKFLLANYAKPNDKILDTHFGSGYIAIACNELGFNLTASEIDQDYFNAACLRVREANKQGDLFRDAV